MLGESRVGSDSFSTEIRSRCASVNEDRRRFSWGPSFRMPRDGGPVAHRVFDFRLAYYRQTNPREFWRFAVLRTVPIPDAALRRAAGKGAFSTECDIAAGVSNGADESTWGCSGLELRQSSFPIANADLPSIILLRITKPIAPEMGTCILAIGGPGPPSDAQPAIRPLSLRIGTPSEAPESQRLAASCIPG